MTLPRPARALGAWRATLAVCLALWQGLLPWARWCSRTRFPSDSTLASSCAVVHRALLLTPGRGRLVRCPLGDRIGRWGGVGTRAELTPTLRGRVRVAQHVPELQEGPPLAVVVCQGRSPKYAG